MCLERAEAGSYGGILNIEDRWQAIKEKGNSTTRRNQLIQEYNRLNKEVRNSARHDKRKWIESIAERAEAAATNNMKELYKSTKSLTRKCYATDITLKSKSGDPLTSAEDKLNVGIIIKT
nr:unnamed protein product [Callosobruchus analis]